MIFDHAWIAARIPHHGDMCLLDGVESWSADSVTCLAESHRNPANPLRAGERLGVANAIEYAAQAMAVHGALLAGSDEAPAAGYLTSVRDVKWAVSRLDDIAAPLRITAERLTGDANNILYAFRINAADKELASGRASVRLDAGKAD